jgi:hypothetical protein
MLILILHFFQVTLWDGSRVEGAAGNKKAAKQNATNRKLKAHANNYLWWKVCQATKWRQIKCLQVQADANIFRNYPGGHMLPYMEDGFRVWQAIRSQAIRMMPSKCSF